MVFIFSLISDTLLWKYGFSAEEDLAKAEIEHSLSDSRIAPASGRDFSAIWNDLNKVHGDNDNPGFLSETNSNLY